MISRKRVRDFNKILTCLLCKGYLIEATTINTCMHSFCRSCIVKHIKLYETCPTCESEIRLGNLRPDYRLQSIVYKIIPGLYAKERQKITNDGYEHRIILNGSGATLVNKLYDISNEDETLAKQYFYDPDEPISLSLEYHMESIFGSNNISSLSNNIPQVRYLQAPAAFKVLHLKKFLSSKYDLNNLKKPMCIDIIYEGDILSDEFTLMDIAYTYKWEREAPLKLFYRIYKSKKHNNTSNEINLVKKALTNQPFVKLNIMDGLEKITKKVSSGVIDGKGHNNNNHYDVQQQSSHHNGNSSKRSNLNLSTSQQTSSSPPRHDLKIIIAKKPSSKNSKVKLNKPNSGSSNSSGNYISKVLNDCERLRGNVDNFTSSEFASTSEMKTTLSKKTGTVSHHDLKFENKSSSSSKHTNNNKNNNKNTSSSSNSDSHDSYEFTVNEGEKEKQKRENTKHTNSSSLSSSFSTSTTTTAQAMTVEKFKVKSSLSLNIPKLKIELPSLKTNISIPKTPNESYAISKSPFSNNAKCEPQVKKVRFDMSNTKDRCYDFDEELEQQQNSLFDQRKYAERIGLRPVERKVESIILHRKRKKSKHSREIDSHSSKKPKLHVSSSLDDESLKLKLKIMGGKKSDKKFNNNEEEAYEKTCNFKTTKEKHKEALVEPLENHKYSVTEQKITKNSDSDQPMVFIPKLVLQKTSLSSSSSSSSSTTITDNNKNNLKKEEATLKVQRRNSILKEPQSEKSKSSSSSSVFDVDKSKDIKLKIKPLDKLSASSTESTTAKNKNNEQMSKLMKPPTAKMGSPSSSQISSTLASSPIRPNSIPASLKLSPIIATTASPTISVKSDLQLQNQNLKRSLSLGAEKSPHCYINPYAKTNTEMFTRDPPLVKIPPLIPTSSTIRNFYNNNNFNRDNEQIAKVSPVTISKVPNINVKDPMKLFPNACPSVEILKIPQTASNVNQQHQPSIKNVKLNRQMPPTTIPLEKIKQTAQQQQQLLQGISPKLIQSQHNNNLMKLASSLNYHQAPKINLPHSGDLSFNSQDPCHSPITNDISLERYHYELSKDISKLDQSLSLEKNFEHWGKMKLQEFSKISDLKSFASSPTAKSLLNQQNINLSVRNIPNPSALMMNRNNQNNNNNANVQKSQAASPTVSSPTCKNTVSSSTSEQCSDIEEIISKSTIARGFEKNPFAEFNSFNFLSRSFAPTAFSTSTTSTTTAANHSKINEKKSIEKLTEYLRQTATAAKSKQEMKQDDDNNNNNSSASSKNDKNFNLIDGGRQKSSSIDVICIDS
ncbi:hypothetical protein PVAND_007287 [Polypedilum vanderplanki]|uniref:RING-type domain-containing protein n=1 Tax=Polypedilum vanderplanki TaxID=319348 RepID=A0A9J6C6D0_POLVA|nr:hypothetical protein PVAND_007287 [Polypedilum vanderplanki]